MSDSPNDLAAQLKAELYLLWQAHRAAGLEGYMCLYTSESQTPWRSQEAGIRHWFNEEGTDDAVANLITHYRHGKLPNSPLLLNPIVHEKTSDESYKPLGSGVVWCSALCLGIDSLKPESVERLRDIHVSCDTMHRGDSKKAGLKVLCFVDRPAKVMEDGITVEGCRELYELAGIISEEYAPYYMLSGMSYLATNGMFNHPDFAALLPGGKLPKKTHDLENITAKMTVPLQVMMDSAFCWKSYDHHHSLYKKFGNNPADVPKNLRFFNLVARDVKLFDATGPMRKDLDESFEFIVPGWIPMGGVTLLAATGGTGKSSLAHYLAVMASIDYAEGETPPNWLGRPLNVAKCAGINVYFSGEDGAPIINARAKLFDPEGRASRLMFQRTDFGENMGFGDFLTMLRKIPQAPLMVIDPARKYLTGDEDDSSVVSDFFEAIEEFAIRKRAAVVVVHHLQKGANPKTAREVLDMLRGSQVFIDRPRVVIGMFRDGPYTIAGLAKNNIPPNMGMVTDECVFARDPEKLQLVQLPGERGVRRQTLSAEELEEIRQQQG